MNANWPVRYRPREWENMLGQGPVCQILQKVAEDGSVPAVLLCGRSGTGKTSALRIYARDLICPGSTSPIEDHPDFTEIDASTAGGVADVREMAKRIEHVPVSGRYRFVLFDEIHAMTRDGFNVLLKMIEEPSSHVRFGFATTNTAKVPQTILGRSMVFSLRTISPEQLVAYIKQIAVLEAVTVSDDVLQEIATLSGGQVRDAIKLLQQVSVLDNPTTGVVRELEGLSAAVQEREFVSACFSKDVDAVTDYCNTISELGVDVERFVQGCIRVVDASVASKFATNRLDTDVASLYDLMRGIIILLSELRAAPGIGSALLRAWAGRVLGIV